MDSVKAPPTICKKAWSALALTFFVCLYGQPASGADILPANAPMPARDYLNFAMTRDGDARHGRELFLGEKVGCVKCHTVDGSSGRAGPDLSSVGDSIPRREL